MKEVASFYIVLLVLIVGTRSAIQRVATAQSIAESLNSNMEIVDSRSITTAELATMRSVELNILNQLRELHGCGKVVLNQTLNMAAQSHAYNLSQLQSTAHSKAGKSGIVGQNTFKSRGSPKVNYQMGSAVVKWYNEIAFYNFDTGKSNDSSKTVLHFTAEIWCSIKNVGFGFYGVETMINGEKGAELYVVANFDPTPNIIGKYKQNIPRLVSGK